MKMLIARSLVAVQDGVIYAMHEVLNARPFQWASDLVEPWPSPEEMAERTRAHNASSLEHAAEILEKGACLDSRLVATEIRRVIANHYPEWEQTTEHAA